MTEWIVQLIDRGGYWGIFVLMVLENIFPPIPSEVIMGIGGIRVGQGELEMAPLLASGVAGTLIGNIFWYVLGWRLGVKRLKPLVDRYGRWATLDWHEVEALNAMFKRRGPVIVFLFRMLPTFRTLISVPAGLFHMGWLRFIVWTTAGSAVWIAVLAGAGYYLGRNFRQIDAVLGPIATATIMLAVGYYVWRLVRWRPHDRCS